MVMFSEGELATPGVLFLAKLYITSRDSLMAALSLKVIRWVPCNQTLLPLSTCTKAVQVIYIRDWLGLAVCLSSSTSKSGS